MKTLFARLKTFAHQQPDACAVQSGSLTLTYTRLYQDVVELAGMLDALRVRSLAIYLDNGVEWIVVDLACQLAGVSVVPLPWFFSPTQRRHACADGSVQWIVASEALPPDVAGYGPARPFYRDALIHEIAAIAPPAENGLVAERGAKISYTSGTTGQPKGIVLASAMIEQTALSIAELLAPLAIEKHLSVLPYATLLENIAGIYVPLLLGKTVCAEPAAQIGLTANLGLDSARFAGAIARSGAGSLIITPQLLEVLCLLVEKGLLDPHPLRFVAVGGARVAIDLLQRATELGIPAYEGYGLTEFASVALLNTPTRQRPGSAGRPLPGVELKIADDGEILLARQLEDCSTETCRVEVATGDLGHVDGDGFVHISGRKSNLIVLSTGRNVSPEWIEAELGGSRLIQQCLVHGEARPHLSALIYAAEPALSDLELDKEIQRINEQLPGYARIREWSRLTQAFSVDQGTLTPNGRPRRKTILARLESSKHAKTHLPNQSFPLQENSSC